MKIWKCVFNYTITITKFFGAWKFEITIYFFYIRQLVSNCLINAETSKQQWIKISKICKWKSQNPNIKLEVDDRVLNSLKDYRINKIKKRNIDSKLSKSKSRWNKTIW